MLADTKGLLQALQTWQRSYSPGKPIMLTQLCKMGLGVKVTAPKSHLQDWKGC